MAMPESGSGMPEFPLHLGRLTVPQRWLCAVNSEEAAAAAADPDAGLVAEFFREHSDPERPTKATGVHILCFRTETYAALEVSTRSLAVAEIICSDEDPSAKEDLMRLATVVNHREHLKGWPSHRWWGGVADIEAELTPCDSHSPACKCNLPGSAVCQTLCAIDHVHTVHTRCCGPACQTLRLASCEVHLARAGAGDAEGGAAAESAGYTATISLYLEAAAFDLDARLNAGAARADFSAELPVQTAWPQ